MKRRDFIRNSAMAGGAAVAISQLSSCVRVGDKPLDASDLTYIGKEIPEKELLQELENEYLKVEIYNDASVDIQDLKNDRKWHIGAVALQEEGPIEQGHVWLRIDRSMCEQYPGRFVGARAGDDIRFTVYGPQNVVFGRFRCRIYLDNEWLKYKIFEIDKCLESLVFPPPVDSDSLVLPIGIGKLINNKERRGIFTRYAYSFYSRMNMRWVGGQKEDGAWMCIMDKGFEDMLSMVGNSYVSPGYMKSLSKWSHPFEIQYTFVKGNYVTLAKIYRRWFKEKGLFRSLKEKAEVNPDVKQLYGSRGFWYTLAGAIPRERDAEDFLKSNDYTEERAAGKEIRLNNTYKEAIEVIRHIESLGMKKGLMKIAGWIHKGYDWSHPDVWPPEKELGSIEEFKELMAMKGKSIMGLHDNYADMYENLPRWPKGVIQRENGTYLRGGFWGGGQAYIMNYRDSLEYAKENWEKLKVLNPKAMFVDTTTAVYLYQSYEKGKEYTKADDHHYKTELVKFFANAGILFGSEEVADFAIPHIHWYETRHERVEGETIPLWPLVFHDAALVCTYQGSQESAVYPKWMESMLWGYMMYFHVRNGGVNEDIFKDSLVVDEWHEKIAEAEMLSHEFMTDDFKVEKTTFSSGHSIICNFSEEDRVVDGIAVGAGDFKILHS
jgi:hypothetical protein